MNIYKEIEKGNYRDAAMIADTTADNFYRIFKYYDNRIDNIDLLKDKVNNFIDFMDEYAEEDIMFGKLYSAGLGIPDRDIHEAIESISDIIPDDIIIEYYENMRDIAYEFYRHFIDFADILLTIYDLIDYD